MLLLRALVLTMALYGKSVGWTNQPPVIPGGGGDSIWRGNEPVGMTPITERPFSAINEAGFTDGAGSGEFEFRSDGDGPHSPPGMLHAWLPAGFVGGGGPVAMDYPSVGNYRTVYFTYWMKYSTVYQNQTAGSKQWYLFTSNGVGVLFFDSYPDAGGAYDPMEPIVESQVLVTPPGNSNWHPNLVPSARIPRGDWFNMEVAVTGNTAGTNDGTLDWWLNGTHVGSITGIQFEAGGTTWGRWRPTTLWGGSGQTVAVLQHIWWDHAYLSGKN